MTALIRLDVSTPVITGLDNEDLQAALNEKYLNENKELRAIRERDCGARGN